MQFAPPEAPTNGWVRRAVALLESGPAAVGECAVFSVPRDDCVGLCDGARYDLAGRLVRVSAEPAGGAVLVSCLVEEISPKGTEPCSSN